MADDYLGSTSTTGTVSIGGSRVGSIETGSDTDWFKVTLIAGHTYTFGVEGSDTGQGTLADPFMRLRNSSGTSLLLDDDSGVGSNSLITYTATTGGTYFISAGSFSSTAIGTYRVKATDLTPPASVDDYASSTSTTGTVSIGGSRTGSIESAADADWFKVTLIAGHTYTFGVEGSDSGQGTLADPFMRLRNSSGTSLLFDDDSGTGSNSSITYTATTGGTYYISAGSYSSTGTGTYRVRAADVTTVSQSPMLINLPVSGINQIVQGNRDNDDSHKVGTALQWGYDFLAPSGSDVRAVAGGTVVAVKESHSGNFAGYGNVVTILHDGGYYATYAHLSYNSVAVEVNGRVEAGTIIAKSGGSGTYSGGSAHPHLHIQFGNIASTINTKNGDASSAVKIADGSAAPLSPAYFSKLVIKFSETDATDTNYVGMTGIDDFTGNSKSNVVNGVGGNDILRGQGGDDKLTGGSGRDTLSGGIGSDTFDFNSISESGASLTTCDVIADFRGSGTDKIDISSIAGTFSFIGTAGFAANSTNQVRFVRYDTNADSIKESTLILIDNDLDTSAESYILLKNYIGALVSADFIL